MKRLLILVRPDARRVSDIVASAKEHDITVNELMPHVFILVAGPRGTLEEPLRGLLGGTAYVLASYTAARANHDRWQNLLGAYAESRVGEPGAHDRYVLLHRLGANANALGFLHHLASIGVNAKELAPGVYVSQPSAAEAPIFSARLGQVVEELSGDAAVVRFGATFTSSLPI